MRFHFFLTDPTVHCVNATFIVLKEEGGIMGFMIIRIRSGGVYEQATIEVIVVVCVKVLPCVSAHPFNVQ